MNPCRFSDLHALGQRVWLDNLTRGHIRDGRLAQLIAQGVTGITSNPTIFHKAVSEGSDYTAQLGLSSGKPSLTRSGATKRWSARPSVAGAILRSMKRGQYIILPGAEISLYYRLTFWLGSAVYPLMDYLLARARRKKARLERG